MRSFAHRSGSWGRRSRLRTLPAAVRGKSSTHDESRRQLVGGEARHGGERSQGVEGRADRALGRSRTNAHTTSPNVSSGAAHTATSSTSGCSASTSSTSRAEMFSPPRMMMSLTRSVIVRIPVGVEPALVAGAEPRAVDERLVVERRVSVADELAWTARQDLALLAGSARRPRARRRAAPRCPDRPCRR